MDFLACLQLYWLKLLGYYSLSGGFCYCSPSRWHLAWDYQVASQQEITNQPIYQLFIIVENSQLSKLMNYIKRGFSTLTIPWTAYLASFGMPLLMEKWHSSHNSRILLICNEGCWNSALHRCIHLIHVRKIVANLLHWQTKLFLAYRITYYTLEKAEWNNMH